MGRFKPGKFTITEGPLPESHGPYQVDSDDTIYFGDVKIKVSGWDEGGGPGRVRAIILDALRASSSLPAHKE